MIVTIRVSFIKRNDMRWPQLDSKLARWVMIVMHIHGLMIHARAGCKRESDVRNDWVNHAG